MGTMDDAIEDRIGDRRIAEVLMPAVARELAGDDRRPHAVPVIEDFEEVLTVGVFESDQPPIVEDQDIDPGEAR